jgi:hypothetical protein
MHLNVHIVSTWIDSSQEYSKSFCFVVLPQDFLQYHLEPSLSIHIEIFSNSLFPCSAGSNVDTVHVSVKSYIISMAPTSKHLN